MAANPARIRVAPARAIPRARGVVSRLAGVALLLVTAPSASACDICAIYTGTLMQMARTGPWLAVSEQYVDFGSIRDQDGDVPNADNEWIHGSTTQLVAGWAFAPNVSLQVNVPLIAREYRRVEDGHAVRGDESGLGDVSVLGRFTPWSGNVGPALLHFEVAMGVKTPTGSSDRLAEAGADDGHGGFLASGPGGQATSPSRPRHGEDGSAIGGDNLALGSGSTDGIFGFLLRTSWKRLFLDGEVQYARRGGGDHGYGYANDLTWRTNLGAYAWLDHRGTLAVSLSGSGDDKGEDRHRGDVVEGSALTSVYLGPGLLGTWKDRLSAQFVVDLPVVQDVSGTSIVADYRLRGGLVWHF